MERVFFNPRLPQTRPTSITIINAKRLSTDPENPREFHAFALTETVPHFRSTVDGSHTSRAWNWPTSIYGMVG
jgi:hypothetical protein